MFEDMINRSTAWLEGSGAEAEIVLSSRVRLARNISGVNFPPNASEEELEQVLSTAVDLFNAEKPNLKGKVIFVKDLSDVDRSFLVERHLVSPEFMQDFPGRGLYINKNENVCVMINEEDHLRMQAISSGLAIEDAFDEANKLDEIISGKIEFDFDSDFGYLTSCPTNVGTGLRASVLIHLPGLVLTRDIDNVISKITKLGLAVRGFYGEGTDIFGNLFQISNQTTLGRSEEDIVESLQQVTDQLIEYENGARNRLFHDARDQLEDKIWRAYGVLLHARVLASDEVMNLLSAVRLGCGMGIIKDVSLTTINELLLLSQPAHLQKFLNKEMSAEERDISRADLVRDKLSKAAK